MPDLPVDVGIESIDLPIHNLDFEPRLAGRRLLAERCTCLDVIHGRQAIKPIEAATHNEGEHL